VALERRVFPVRIGPPTTAPKGDHFSLGIIILDLDKTFQTTIIRACSELGSRSIHMNPMNAFLKVSPARNLSTEVPPSRHSTDSYFGFFFILLSYRWSLDRWAG
jgi:hypothetical protein